MKTASLSLALFLFPASVLAGDYAHRDILGFSPDGGTFAFEEYGVPDTDEFPYSVIYVIDTCKDEWGPGAPVRPCPAVAGALSTTASPR